MGKNHTCCRNHSHEPPMPKKFEPDTPLFKDGFWPTTIVLVGLMGLAIYGLVWIFTNT